MSMLLSIDPGTRKMGWALFHVTLTRKVTLENSGTMVKRGDSDWLLNAWGMREEMNRLIRTHPEITKVLIEQPRHYSGGVGAAARNSDAILKLMFLIGIIAEICRNKKITVELVPVSKWKGQVPKAITQVRIRKYWGWSGQDHNEADAVGIGDWYFRKYKKKYRLKYRVVRV